MNLLIKGDYQLTREYCSRPWQGSCRNGTLTLASLQGKILSCFCRKYQFFAPTIRSLARPAIPRSLPILEVAAGAIIGLPEVLAAELMGEIILLDYDLSSYWHV